MNLPFTLHATGNSLSTSGINLCKLVVDTSDGLRQPCMLPWETFVKAFCIKIEYIKEKTIICNHTSGHVVTFLVPHKTNCVGTQH